MTFLGVTNKKELVMLDEEAYNNKYLETPLVPSDIAPKFFKFLERNRSEWGFARDVFIDCADQATITELKKFKRTLKIGGVIEVSFTTQYGIRLRNEPNMTWSEFCNLLAGIMPKTPLGGK